MLQYYIAISHNYHPIQQVYFIWAIPVYRREFFVMYLKDPNRIKERIRRKTEALNWRESSTAFSGFLWQNVPTQMVIWESVVWERWLSLVRSCWPRWCSHAFAIMSQPKNKMLDLTGGGVYREVYSLLSQQSHSRADLWTWNTENATCYLSPALSSPIKSVSWS